MQLLRPTHPYVWTAEGWLYVATVVDLFSRRVVGWSMKAEMNVQLLTDAAEMRYGLHPSLQEVHVVQLPKDAAAIPAVQAPIVQEGAAWSVVIPEVSPAQLRLTTYTSWPASSCRDFATVAATTRGTSLYRFRVRPRRCDRHDSNLAGGLWCGERVVYSSRASKPRCCANT